MKPSLQQPLPPMPLNRVDGTAAPDLNKVEQPSAPDRNTVEMPLAEARDAVGRVVRRTIQRTGSGLKDFGDKGQVARWCSGQETPNLARLWQQPEVRRELVIALAEESGVADISTSIVLRRRA